jgi:hypothetical protein
VNAHGNTEEGISKDGYALQILIVNRRVQQKKEKGVKYMEDKKKIKEDERKGNTEEGRKEIRNKVG